MLFLVMLLFLFLRLFDCLGPVFGLFVCSFSSSFFLISFIYGRSVSPLLFISSFGFLKSLNLFFFLFQFDFFSEGRRGFLFFFSSSVFCIYLILSVLSRFFIFLIFPCSC